LTRVTRGEAAAAGEVLVIAGDDQLLLRKFAEISKEAVVVGVKLVALSMKGVVVVVAVNGIVIVIVTVTVIVIVIEEIEIVIVTVIKSEKYLFQGKALLNSSNRDLLGKGEILGLAFLFAVVQLLFFYKTLVQ